jgi:hypothetical protein
VTRAESVVGQLMNMEQSVVDDRNTSGTLSTINPMSPDVRWNSSCRCGNVATSTRALC